jgi:hypothetical protein
VLMVTKPDRLARSTSELLATETDLSRRKIGLGDTERCRAFSRRWASGPIYAAREGMRAKSASDGSPSSLNRAANSPRHSAPLNSALMETRSRSRR